jgi:hypothetical protein
VQVYNHQTRQNQAPSDINRRVRRDEMRATEAKRINAALTVSIAASTFIRAIRETTARNAVVEATPHFARFRRVEGGSGISLIPIRFEAGGSVVYRRARCTRALALWTTIERRTFVRAVKMHPDTMSGAANSARKAFASAMREARERDIAGARSL